MRSDVENAVKLLQENQSGAVERALELLQKTVFAFSMKVCGHREDAEDTMQDVLLKAASYLPQFTHPKALVVWLYTVAKNRCLMNRRKSKFAPRESLSLEELMPDRQELESLAQPGLSPEQSLLHGENAEAVRRAILQVPPLYRLILVLHDMEELSTEEIAAVTGLREGTVRVRLHRARLFVRKEVARPASSRRARPQASARRPGRCKQLFASLSDYLDGVLDDSVCEQMEKHMAGCRPCEAFISSLQKTVEQVRVYSPEGPDPRIAAELRRSLISQYATALERMGRTRAALSR